MGATLIVLGIILFLVGSVMVYSGLMWSISDILLTAFLMTAGVLLIYVGWKIPEETGGDDDK